MGHICMVEWIIFGGQDGYAIYTLLLVALGLYMLG